MFDQYENKMARTKLSKSKKTKMKGINSVILVILSCRLKITRMIPRSNNCVGPYTFLIITYSLLLFEGVSEELKYSFCILGVSYLTI